MMCFATCTFQQRAEASSNAQQCDKRTAILFLRGILADIGLTCSAILSQVSAELSQHAADELTI